MTGEHKMDKSLTKEEFFQRLSTRKALFALAVSEDVKKMFFPESPMTEFQVAAVKTQNSVDVDLSKQIADLLVKESFRIVELVYDEKFD
jgi:hypothetical protein